MIQREFKNYYIHVDKGTIVSLGSQNQTVLFSNNTHR